MTSNNLGRLRLELIETLRDKIYFAKENFANASYFPDTVQYCENVSTINTVYAKFFLYPDIFKVDCLTPGPSYNEECSSAFQTKRSRSAELRPSS